MVKTIEVENVGPVEHLAFHLSEYGVTVLSGRNGIGKSTVLRAVQNLAAGGGRLPLRDGEKRGRVEGFGARLTISGSSRHTGEFEVEHLEGKFDLAELVDPGMADALASDRRRVRALVALTGAKPDVSLFRDNPVFGGPELFDAITSGEATAKHDLVDMAEAIKRCYESAARKEEDQAEQELGRAKALEEQAGEFDPAAEQDEQTLRQAYDRTRDKRAQLTVQRSDAAKAAKAKQEAQEKLDRAKREYTGPSVAEAKDHEGACRAKWTTAKQFVADLEARLAEARAECVTCENAVDLACAATQHAHAHDVLVAQCQEIIDGQGIEPPSDEEILAAEQDFLKARQAQEYGTLARAARAKLADALAHRETAKAAASKAERLRGAAGSIDEVLSGAIKSSVLRFESLDGKARLVVDHAVRGKAVPYHDLSDGERWKVAIDLAADQVGEGGLIVIEQAAWEGIDVYLRGQIHEHARERKVFVLTAEATRNPADGADLKARTYEPAGV